MSRELFVAEPPKTCNSPPPIVVDCSLLAAVLFDEPSKEEALEALAGKALHARNLIAHELISVALRKGEADARVAVTSALRSFAKLRLTRHSIDHQSQFELALGQNISAYDAVYFATRHCPQCPACNL